MTGRRSRAEVDLARMGAVSLCSFGDLSMSLTPEQEARFADDPAMFGCCVGAAVWGPRRCTCWRPVYSLWRRRPVEGVAPRPRPSPCADCAYRGGSAEMRDEGGRELLRELVDGSTSERPIPFWCHQGMAYVVRWVHPSGAVVEASRDEVGAVHTWAPRAVGSVPYKASGRPADYCAGWFSRFAGRVLREDP